MEELSIPPKNEKNIMTLKYRFCNQTGKSIRGSIMSTTQHNIVVHIIWSTVITNNHVSLERRSWETRLPLVENILVYLHNARKINVHNVSDFVHGAIIIMPSCFISAGFTNKLDRLKHRVPKFRGHPATRILFLTLLLDSHTYAVMTYCTF